MVQFNQPENQGLLRQNAGLRGLSLPWFGKGSDRGSIASDTGTPAQGERKSFMEVQDIDINKVDVDALRAELREAKVQFGGRSGPQRLVELAVEHDIEVPLVEDEDKGGNIVPKKYRDRYGAAQHNGDEMALSLKDFVTVEDPETKKKGCSPVALQEVADANGVDLGRWDHLNIGQRRMNLGNVLRGMLNRGERVQVGSRVWEARPKDEADGEERAAKL